MKKSSGSFAFSRLLLLIFGTPGLTFANMTDAVPKGINSSMASCCHLGSINKSSSQSPASEYLVWDVSPRAENAKIDVKVIGASQEMCNYLPLLQKLPAALVIRKVKVTKHSSFKGRVLLRTTLCAFSSFGKGKIIAHNLGTKIGLISHIYFGIFCTGCRVEAFLLHATREDILTTR